MGSGDGYETSIRELGESAKGDEVFDGEAAGMAPSMNEPEGEVDGRWSLSWWAAALGMLLGDGVAIPSSSKDGSWSCRFCLGRNCMANEDEDEDEDEKCRSRSWRRPSDDMLLRIRLGNSGKVFDAALSELFWPRA